MIFRILKIWFLVCFVAVILAGITNLTVQQVYRQSANDPQIQMAEDDANALAGGELISKLTFPNKVDIEKSLAPFIIVFDQNGKVILSQASLNGQDPTLPQGVFDYTRSNNEDRLTWQPQDGVRIAAIVKYYSNGKTTGFVLAGRNLREVENRVGVLNLQVFAGLGVAIIGSFLLIGFFQITTSLKRGKN